tara:strand:- start:16408 stop:17295 length:888 start_codon:yes stop_codon:yes gene_type:complete
MQRKRKIGTLQVTDTNDIKYRQGRSKRKLREQYKFTFVSIVGLIITVLLIAVATQCSYAQQYNYENKYTTILDEFDTPQDYKRKNYDEYSLWLYNLPIHTGYARYHNGGIVKGKGRTYAATFTYEIGNKDLHQCADAAFWLRAYYLWESNRESEIGFHYTDGTYVSYWGWLRDNNITISDYNTFFRYMEHMWIYAGTWSLENLETDTIPITDMQPGDVFVQGGFPGHAVTVVDVAIHNETGHKVFMLAQSYMPAQEQHILIDPQDGDVWFDMKEEGPIYTYTWTFNSQNLRRFKW